MWLLEPPHHHPRPRPRPTRRVLIISRHRAGGGVVASEPDLIRSGSDATCTYTSTPRACLLYLAAAAVAIACVAASSAAAATAIVGRIIVGLACFGQLQREPLHPGIVPSNPDAHSAYATWSGEWLHLHPTWRSTPALVLLRTIYIINMPSPLSTSRCRWFFARIRNICLVCFALINQSTHRKPADPRLCL